MILFFLSGKSYVFLLPGSGEATFLVSECTDTEGRERPSKITKIKGAKCSNYAFWDTQTYVCCVH